MRRHTFYLQWEKEEFLTKMQDISPHMLKEGVTASQPTAAYPQDPPVLPSALPPRPSHCQELLMPQKVGAVPEKNPCKRLVWQIKPSSMVLAECWHCPNAPQHLGGQRGSFDGFPSCKETSDRGRDKNNT